MTSSMIVFLRRNFPKAVIPAKAGIQALNHIQNCVYDLDSRFRGNDDAFGCDEAAL